jgi:hypothetical protein
MALPQELQYMISPPFTLGTRIVGKCSALGLQGLKALPLIRLSGTAKEAAEKYSLNTSEAKALIKTGPNRSAESAAPPNSHDPKLEFFRTL